MPPSHEPIPTEVVRECLERSGYLMESRLVKALSLADYFVEPNVTHKDPRTGKARELDLTAESVPIGYGRGATVKTTFVIEAVNNRFPLVLLTQRPSTPNADFESYLKFAASPEPCPFSDLPDLYEEKGADWRNLFSQFCALTKKSGRDELMASHPDDIYSSLQKLSEYTEDQISEFAEWTKDETGKYWRLFFWHPMLVVSGQLMTATLGESGELQLVEVPLARLEFNWHDAEVRRTTVIEVVREDFLLERCDSIRSHDQTLEQRIAQFRAQCDGASEAE